MNWTYQNIAVELPRFLFFFVFFLSQPSIGTIFATYQNPSDVKYATRNRKMGVKRIEGVSVEY